ncbi:MAG: esterase family protein [Saprospiraceae bacterium]|nr:esterase family protein [Saprospiraceae bacterium]MCB9319406.1 esterase family protein [Lewinellaceae bacterium]
MSHFHTIEVSDPRYTSDGLHFITVKSKALKGRGDVLAYMPDNPAGKTLPIVVLLHGVYGSSWAWALKGAAHRTAAHLIRENRIPPMILAMPSDGLRGDGTGYVKAADADFEHWILDVPEIIHEVFTEASIDKIKFICGLSMGGYGALRLGAKYPEQYSGISAHSSVTKPEEMASFLEEPLASVFIESKDEYSITYWMQKHRHLLPPIRFDCGLEDSLLSANRKLHQALHDLGIRHHYEEFAGGHEWSYWESHLTESLLFFGSLING